MPWSNINEGGWRWRKAGGVEQVEQVLGPRCGALWRRATEGECHRCRRGKRRDPSRLARENVLKIMVEIEAFVDSAMARAPLCKLSMGKMR